MERVFEIAKNGNGYLAVEKSLSVVRRLKKENKIDDCMFFLMKLAHILADNSDWQSASVAALRAIELFPEDATTIKVLLKESFLNFVRRANCVEAATNEFFKFVDNVAHIIGDANNELNIKKIDLAILAKQYFNVQCFVFNGVLGAIGIEESNFDVKMYLEKSMIATWDWILSISDEKDREFSGQFIAGRYLLTYLSIKSGIEMYTQSLQILKDTKPEQISENFFNQPLFNMLNFLKKAMESNSKASAQLVLQKYNAILVKDTELKKWTNILISNAFEETNQQPNIFQMFGNMFGGAAQNTPPPAPAPAPGPEQQQEQSTTAPATEPDLD